MNDQVLVRVGHSVAHVDYELEPPFDRQLPNLAITVDRLAIHELYSEIRRAVRRDAAIHQTCYARVLEAGQDAALLQEAPRQRNFAVWNHPERHALLELAVRALAQKHAAHAPLSDQADYAEWADAFRMRDRIVIRSEQRSGELGSGCIQNAFRAAVRVQ